MRISDLNKKLKRITESTHITELEDELHDNIKNMHNNYVKVVTEKDYIFIDYTDPIAKQRALTVSEAFKIAFKKYVTVSSTISIAIPQVDAYLATSPFKVHAQAFELANDYLKANHDEIYHNLYHDAIKTLESINSYSVLYEPDVKHRIASAAVTLAWFEAFRTSGAFPKDITVMDPNSETHSKLVYEVKHLLERAFIEFTKSVVFLGGDVKTDVPVVNKELGLQDTVDLVINGEVFIIKTTATPDKSINDDIVNAYIAYTYIPWAEAFSVYYPRVSKLVRYKKV